MRITNGYGAIARAIMVMGGVTALSTGATFAALQSQQATLTGNTISSAIADLRIGTSASTFSSSRSGFDFKDLVPGGPAMPTDGNNFYLKNYGTATLALKMAVGTTPVNTGAVDLTKVSVLLTRVDTSASQTFKLSDLVSSYATGGTALTDDLTGGTIAQYKLRISMDADAFSGQSASITGIDLVFSGSAVNL